MPAAEGGQRARVVGVGHNEIDVRGDTWSIERRTENREHDEVRDLPADDFQRFVARGGNTHLVRGQIVGQSLERIVVREAESIARTSATKGSLPAGTPLSPRRQTPSQAVAGHVRPTKS